MSVAVDICQGWTAVASGFLSSVGATTSAVVLYRGGPLGVAKATIAILLATVASIVVKALLAATSTNRAFGSRSRPTAACSCLAGRSRSSFIPTSDRQ